MSSARAALGVALLSLCALAGKRARAQQFNSDSYISKPHGMVTTILTTGEHTTMFMMTFSLFRNWEFTAAGYFFNTDADRKTAEGTQYSLYAKYMFYENKEKTGGFAVKGGTGMKPSYILDGSGYQTSSQTWWMNAPATIPFFDNKLSWDIMPGWSATLNSEGTGKAAWAVTNGAKFNGSPGSGFEIGAMLFSPPFLCFSGCR